ncbi:hypothetical protein [Maioricimonas sp. JC845]|uniref:hypothetical protein n=1 Tax=Maioricimonas sp. JC845 TaxID=3232138 RepID=UPI003457F574
MRFVLLGDDPDGIALLQAVNQSPEHVIAAAVGVSNPEVLSRLSPDVERLEDWRRVLTVADIDAALVATSDPDLLAGARQLASQGTSLAIVPCRRQDTAFAYELALVQDERPVTILPLFRHLNVPAIQAFKAIVDAGLGGDTELVRIERTLPADETGRRLSRNAVEAQLFHDIALLRWLFGEYTRLTAIFGGETEAGLLSATITLAGDDVPEATWTIRGDDDRDDFALEAAMTEGTVRLRKESTEPYALDSDGGLAVESVQQPPESPGEIQLALITHALAGPDDSLPTWTDAVRTFDLVDAVQRSIRRRRTIDLHFESMSERSQFKTQMTALGCGVLSLTTVGMVLLLLVGAIFDPRDVEQQRAESAGLILHSDDFETGSAEFSPRGEEHVRQILEETGQSSAAIIVERAPDAPDADLSEQRAERVRAELAEAGLEQADERVIVRKLNGGLFQSVMTVAWVILFLPLFAFLATQVLILLTHPPRDETDRTSE